MALFIFYRFLYKKLGAKSMQIYKQKSTEKHHQSDIKAFSNLIEPLQGVGGLRFLRMKVLKE